MQDPNISRMESIIDIQLVKEQLRLLGHDVADDVILEFVKGLNKAPGGPNQAASTVRASNLGSEVNDAAVRDAKAGLNSRPDAGLSALDSSKASARQPATAQQLQGAASHGAHTETDAAPSKLQQAPDQQSPKRVPAAGLAVHEQDSPPPAMLQRPALDQRCRNFLSRCSDKPSLQQQQQQQQQAHQQQPILLQVPQVPGSAHTSTHSSSHLSSAGSSELLLGRAGIDSESSDGSAHSLGQRQYSAARLLGQTLPQHVSDAGLGWAQPQQQQQWQSQLGAELAQDDSSSGSDSEGSSVGLEAEGSKFLLHQAATMQRVRARLAAKMAGYTAAASAAQAGSGVAQPQAQHAAASARADRADISDASSRGAASSAGSSHSSGLVDSSSELPRYGFRPGYKPIGIHMPPPPSPVAVEALAAACALRQHTATGAPAAAAKGSKGGPVPPLKLDMPQQMESLTSAVNRLHQQQQQAAQQQHGRVDPVLLPSVAGINSSSLHLVASPGKAACASAVAGARASGSIIGGETPPCIAASGSKTRQSPRVDPLYLAPSSPRRSNPATPRSSPALSPAPLAPLSAAAVGIGLMRSPAGHAPAAATVGAGRSASSNGSRQCLCFSAASRVVSGRGSAQQQQQQRESASGSRRVSSAPSAVAPSAALRGPGSGIGSSSANGSYSARRSNVSHESLYCQRLAYSSQCSTVAPGVRKTDRVARFQQMQQQWARDRFLSSGAGGATAKKSAGQ